MTNTTETFLKYIDRSRKSVLLAADILSRLDCSVMLPPYDRVDTRKEEWKHLDKGDLFIGETPVEVKHLENTHFTINNWPHPFVIVDSVGNYDGKGGKSPLYMIFSDDLQTYLTVPPRSQSYMRIAHLNDKINKTKKDYYIIDVDQVKFHEVNI